MTHEHFQSRLTHLSIYLCSKMHVSPCRHPCPPLGDSGWRPKSSLSTFSPGVNKVDLKTRKEGIASAARKGEYFAFRSGYKLAVKWRLGVRSWLEQDPCSICSRADAAAWERGESEILFQEVALHANARKCSLTSEEGELEAFYRPGSLISMLLFSKGKETYTGLLGPRNITSGSIFVTP